MAEDLEMEEPYDNKVRLMAEKFNFDISIVQECFEKSLYPSLLKEKEPAPNKSGIYFLK